MDGCARHPRRRRLRSGMLFVTLAAAAAMTATGATAAAPEAHGDGHRIGEMCVQLGHAARHRVCGKLDRRVRAGTSEPPDERHERLQGDDVELGGAGGAQRCACRAPGTGHQRVRLAGDAGSIVRERHVDEVLGVRLERREAAGTGGRARASGAAAVAPVAVMPAAAANVTKSIPLRRRLRHGCRAHPSTSRLRRVDLPTAGTILPLGHRASQVRQPYLVAFARPAAQSRRSGSRSRRPLPRAPRLPPIPPVAARCESALPAPATVLTDATGVGGRTGSWSPTDSALARTQPSPCAGGRPDSSRRP